MEVFNDKNVTLKVKSVSEKTSKFKVLVNDTFKVFYAIFPIFILFNHSKTNINFIFSKTLARIFVDEDGPIIYIENNLLR